MLFILVQIQAGPPRFALTGYAWRSHADRQAKRVRLSLSEKRKRRRTGTPASDPFPHMPAKASQMPVDGPFLGVSRLRKLV